MRTNAKQIDWAMGVRMEQVDFLPKKHCCKRSCGSTAAESKTVASTLYQLVFSRPLSKPQNSDQPSAIAAFTATAVAALIVANLRPAIGVTLRANGNTFPVERVNAETISDRLAD